MTKPNISIKVIKIMRILRKIYSIIFLILFWTFFISCKNGNEVLKEKKKDMNNYVENNEDSLFLYLDSILKTQDDNSTNIQYIVLDAIYKIRYPKLENKSFDSFMQNLKNYILTQKFCESPLDTFTPQINIEYNVLTVTKNFLSMEENVSVLFCSIEHSFRNYYNVMLTFPEEQMYVVELNDSNIDLIRKIRKECEKKKMDYDCKCDINDELLEIFFKNKQPYIYYSEGVLCEYSIPLNFMQRGYISFKPFNYKKITDSLPPAIYKQ